MKKNVIIMLALMVFGAYSCNCNQPDVPKEVLTSFSEMFPDASDAEWEMEDEDEWVVEFELNEKEMEAEFSNEGTWIETETELEIDELPNAIVIAIENNHEGYEIDETEWIESPDFVGFEVEVVKGSDMLEILLTENGEIVEVKSRQVKEDDTD